jgi:hypothetical protein
MRWLACLVLALAATASEGDAVVSTAVGRGLDALAALQAADGGYESCAGITGLAGLAFLASGSTPWRGPHAAACARAVDFVLARQDRATGYLGHDQARMYGHGFATRFLATAYGSAPDARVRPALAAALDLLIRSQAEDGSWSYDPDQRPGDVSITACQIMALRAAWDAGVGDARSVAASERAVAFVRRLARGGDGYAYSIANPDTRHGLAALPRAAAAATCLAAAGDAAPGDPLLGPALALVRRYAVEHAQGGRHRWYGLHYAALAVAMAGSETDREAWRDEVVPVVLGFQQIDGSWPAFEGPGTGYGTAMAIGTLLAHDGYLPDARR